MRGPLYTTLAAAAVLLVPPLVILGVFVVVVERFTHAFKLALSDYRHWRDFESKSDTGASR